MIRKLWQSFPPSPKFSSWKMNVISCFPRRRCTPAMAPSMSLAWSYMPRHQFRRLSRKWHTSGLSWCLPANKHFIPWFTISWLFYQENNVGCSSANDISHQGAKIAPGNADGGGEQFNCLDPHDKPANVSGGFRCYSQSSHRRSNGFWICK